MTATIGALSGQIDITLGQGGTRGGDGDLTIVSLVASPLYSNGTQVALTATISDGDSDPLADTLHVHWFVPVNNVTFVDDPSNSRPYDQSLNEFLLTEYVTLSKVGTYVFSLTAWDTNSSASTTVTVVANPIVSGLAITPEATTVGYGETKQFSGVWLDQFGAATAGDYAIIWRNTGDGSIGAASGLYVAPASGTGATIYASGDGFGAAPATVTLTSGLGEGNNSPPTIVVSASASPNVVTGTTTSLSVLAADDGGESNLSYEWTQIGSYPALVTFSDNDDNSAKNAVVTFSKAGTYQFNVTAINAGGLTSSQSIASEVTVTVQQTVSGLYILPSDVEMPWSTLDQLSTYVFAATAIDQFGDVMPTPNSVTWATSDFQYEEGDGAASLTYTAPLDGSASPVALTASIGTLIKSAPLR